MCVACSEGPEGSVEPAGLSDKSACVRALLVKQWKGSQQGMGVLHIFFEPSHHVRKDLLKVHQMRRVRLGLVKTCWFVYGQSGMLDSGGELESSS